MDTTSIGYLKAELTRIDREKQRHGWAQESLRAKLNRVEPFSDEYDQTIEALEQEADTLVNLCIQQTIMKGKLFEAEQAARTN